MVRLATIAVLAVSHATSWARAAEIDPCRADVSQSARVERAVDGSTLALTDGTTVRLAAIEPPAADHVSEAYDPAAAAAALATLVAGQAVSFGGPRIHDRHGRLVAFVYVRQNGADVSVQQHLLAHGHARVGVRVGDRECAASLLRIERMARSAKLGLWGDPYYELKRAEEPAVLGKQRGRLALVEGKVSSVRESGGTIYVNFGRRWSEDFTVTVAKRNERLFSAAGVALKDLAERRVRVRGFVEDRGGPWIEMVAPEQIETVEGN